MKNVSRMKIAGKDALELQQLLRDTLEIGCEYMVFNRAKQFLQPHDGYPYFKHKEEAERAAAYLNQAGQENIVLPVAAVEQHLSRELEWQRRMLPALVTPKDILLPESSLAIKALPPPVQVTTGRKRKRGGGQSI